MPSQSKGHIRPLQPGDLAAVAELLNRTWKAFDLYEPVSADALADLIERVPAYDFENVQVLEEHGEIAACLGSWDWSQIACITVQSLNPRMRLIRLGLSMIRPIRPTLQLPRPGDPLRQMVLTPIGYKDPKHLGTLLVHLNNQALKAGIGQIFCICEHDSSLLNSMTGFIRLDTRMHLYVKALVPDLSIGERPVFVDGIDL
jgi:hypothetical protein